MTSTIRFFTLCGALLGMLAPAAATAQARPSIAAQQAQIATLQSQVATLQTQVATGTIPGVSGYATMDVSIPSRPTLRFAGANLQVVNGTGDTIGVNGLGNVIVGYDEAAPPGGAPTCNFGEYWDNEGICLSAGGVWDFNHKSGSHNVVVGRYHSYSRYGGVVAGTQNAITGPASSVTGGNNNLAAGGFAAVSGGASNKATGTWSSVSGGTTNRATGPVASVSGGSTNLAVGNSASVSGGYANGATGLTSSVSGGSSNLASGFNSNVSGGKLRTAAGPEDWVAGALFQNE